MTKTSRSMILAAALVAAGSTGAWAQSSATQTYIGPTSTTMTPGPGATPADENPRVPGATGQAIVPGDNSTVAGDRAATIEQRTGVVSGR
jgi:hypothetical protein